MEGQFQNNLPGDRLLMHIQDIEALEERKKEISDQISDRFKAAKAEGFDAPTMRSVIKRRKLTKPQREEIDAMLQIYEASIGGLGDTELGQAARKRLDREWTAREMKRNLEKQDPEGKQDELEELIDKLAEDEKAGAPTEEQIEAAKREGSIAATSGKRVTDNPYTKEGPLRAAWDMGWCQARGSDGMEIPKAFQRSKPKKEAAGEGEEKPDEGADDEKPDSGEPDGEEGDAD